MVEATTAAFGGSPAHHATRISRDVLEDVLLDIKSLGGRVDRSAIVTRLEQAISGMHQLGSSSLSSPDHLDLLQRATERVKLAYDAVEGIEISEQSLAICGRLRGVVRTLDQAREATIDALVASQQQHLEQDVVRRSEQSVPEQQPFALSRGVPRLHAIKRELMRTHVDVEPDDFVFDAAEEAPELDDSSGVGEPEGGSTELSDLLGESEDAFEEDDREPIDPAKRLPLLVEESASVLPTMMSGLDGEMAQLSRLIRTALEDIGAMSLLRRFGDNERFDMAGAQRFERRMCECLDAVVALGEPFYTAVAPGGRYGGMDVLTEAIRYGRDAVTADPQRAFARSFVMTSIAGEDTVRAAILALKQSPPFTYDAQAEALALSPNPNVSKALERLSRDDDERLAALALSTLCRRGDVHIGVASALIEHPAEEVRIGAIAALGRARERAAAVELLIGICDNESDDDVVIEAIAGLIRFGEKEGLTRLRERLDEEEEEQGSLRADLRARCMQMLGMAGQAEDLIRLQRLYYGDDGQALALGFHGHPVLVEDLIEALSSSPQQGMYLGLRGRQQAAQALYRITGAPLFADKGDPYEMTTRTQQWRQWWDENEERFEPDVRYRFGQPFSLIHSVFELEQDHVPFGIRKACAQELALSIPEPRLSVFDFVARQQDIISQLRATIEAASAEGDPRFAPGRWMAWASPTS